MVKEDLPHEFYSGFSTFGRIEAWFGAIVGTIIGIILFIVGIVLIRKKHLLVGTAEGTIKNDPVCTTNYVNKDTQAFNCSNMNIEYSVNNTKYNITESIKGSSSNYIKGSTITVYYNPNNPSDGKLDNDDSHVIGWVMFVMGILFATLPWVWVYITSKSKVAAAAGGVGTFINMVR
jgi:hypothetical protein